MYDHQIISPGQIQCVSWNSRNIWYDKVYTDRSNMNKRVGKRQSSIAISKMVGQAVATCPKILPNNRTIFTEATAIIIAMEYLEYCQHMGPVRHDVNSLLWLNVLLAGQSRVKIPRTLSFAKSWTSSGYWTIRVYRSIYHFCWISSHCGIFGNERVGQLAKDTLENDIDPLASVHCVDLKPLVNFYIQ